MIKNETQKLSAYKGDYRPVQVYKNAVNSDGYKITGMQGKEGSFEGTYNDYLTLCGKCGYKDGKNLCPTPISAGSSNYDGGVEYSWKLTPNADGTFNFSGAMALGSTVAIVTLPAGTYTASGCELIQLWWKEKGEFQLLPTTFTLENESDISCVLWYTSTSEITLENQYIQIEAGESATEFSPYCGNPAKPPAPDNIRPVIGAKGTVRSRGKNLFDYSIIELSPSHDLVNATFIEELDNGIIAQGNDYNGMGDASYGNGWFHPGNKGFGRGYGVALRAGDVVNVSCDYTVLEKMFPESRYSPNVYLYGTTGHTSASGIVPEVGVKVRLNATYTVAVDGLYYPVVTLNANKVKIENIQIQIGTDATEYHPYFGEHTISAPELFGIEVDADAPYNYTETVDGVTKYYIADSFSGNALTKRIGKIELDGSENWFSFEDNEHEREFVLDIRTAKYAASINKSAITCICNVFEGLSREKIWNKQLGISNTSSYIRVSQGYDDVFGADVNTFKSFLKELYSVGTPLTVYYVLAEPYIVTYYGTNIETGVTEPLTAKTFPRFTHVTAAYDENHLCYGMAKCIKIAK